MAGNQGLGSNNMSQQDKDRIHSEGGKASSTTGTSQSSTGSSSSTTTNSKGGGALDKDAQRRGGQNSHRN